MFKRLKVKLYPTHKQKQMLEDHFGSYRYCYNLCLEYKSTLWSDHKKNVSGFDMQKELFQIRKETPWLLKCKAECIRDAALIVDKAFKNFFKGGGFPKFKSKRGEQSFSAYQSIYCKGNKITFFKNKINFKTSQNYEELLELSKIKQVTFKRDLTGQYFASFLIETIGTKELPTTDKDTGIDLGVKTLITTSDGEIFENNRFLRSTYFKLRRLQRKHSKTKKGGKNKEKLRVKIATLNRKAVRQKEHHYHQITNKLLHDNQVVYVETLDVKGMLEEKKMSREISDASFGLLISMLEYKALWYGREVIKVDKWFPSSKTCYNCGNVKKDLKLSDRTYDCDVCKFSIDRDLNASLNILKEGKRIKAEMHNKV